MRALNVGVTVASLCLMLFGQVARQPFFEVADVHVSSRSTHPMMRTVLRSGRYEIREATVADLIHTAYSLEPDHIIGGPTWLEYDRFDIIAKAARDTEPETLKWMLRQLLSDRFKLIVHNDTRPMPRFVLTSGKGRHKLEASTSENSGC